MVTGPRRSRRRHPGLIAVTPPLVLTRHVAAAPAEVYSYLTESGRWSLWQGESASLEPWPGGEFAMTMPNGAIARGRFLELVPGEKVVFTWGWVDHSTLPPGSSTVEITIAPDGRGSLITLTHRDLPEEERDIHALGWDHYLPRLAIAAEGARPGPDPGAGN